MQREELDLPGVGRGIGREHILVVAMIAVVTALHYLTPHGGVHDHALHTTVYPWYVNLHGIYRRLYYFPIILAAFRGGLRSGAMSALLVVALYVPHASGMIGHDPGTPIEKILEMVLYLAVGLVSGMLVERISSTQRLLARSAGELRAALDEKTAMEAELIRSTRLAAVGRLSAGLAHEIRNPLASIQGAAEVLSDDFPADHPKGSLLRILLKETARLNDVLSRFLLFARSEPGSKKPFDLVEEVQAVVHLLAHQPGAASVEIRTPDSVCAIGDPERVRQVLLNLAMNASAAAGADGEVRIELNSDGETVDCLVVDSGPGFSEEASANFGTPFYSTRNGGTGLGIATSLRIVEDLGGQLHIDKNGDGGRVRLSLPAVIEPAVFCEREE